MTSTAKQSDSSEKTFVSTVGDLIRAAHEKLLSFIDAPEFLSIQVDITNNCNLTCAHCYHPHHRNDSALDETGWLQVLAQYDALRKKLGRKPYVIICGGEPLVSPLLRPLLTKSSEKWPGVPVTILTNGTLIGAQHLEFFKNFNLSFQVSLDGANESSHDLVRGKHSFARALKGIGLLRDAGFAVSILSILSQRTAPIVGDFFNLAKALDATEMNFVRLVAEGAGESLVAKGADAPLLGFALRDALVAILANSKRTGVATNSDGPLFHLIDPALGDHGLFGFQGLVVDYKGNLKVSSRAPVILGNVLNDGLENLFMSHPIMQDLRSRKIEGCGTCKFYKKCGGDRNAAFAADKSFLKPDPGCWILGQATN